MIKATELQIGDYVLVDGKPRRVESITEKKIGYHINPQTDKRLYYARLHDVEPIEVTEEMLEKNGFDKKGMRTIYFLDGELVDNFQAVIRFDIQFKNVKVVRQKFIKPKEVTLDDFATERSAFVESLYIHQLQQACRMCGIKIDWKL